MSDSGDAWDAAVVECWGEQPRGASVMTAKISAAWGALVSACWRRLGVAMFDSYRPELHYMRGAGPKWHEKHAPGRMTAA